jgi:hypothetical protein
MQVPPAGALTLGALDTVEVRTSTIYDLWEEVSGSLDKDPNTERPIQCPYCAVTYPIGLG